MEHDLELFSPILEILEIGVCNIIYNPGNYWKLDFFDFLLSWKYWKLDFFSTSSYPGNIGNLIFQFSHILEILEI